jgi:hypothetical protein
VRVSKIIKKKKFNQKYMYILFERVSKIKYVRAIETNNRLQQTNNRLQQILNWFPLNKRALAENHYSQRMDLDAVDQDEKFHDFVLQQFL